MPTKTRAALSNEQIARLRETLTNLKNADAGYPVAAVRLLDLAGMNVELAPQLSGRNRKQLQSTAKTTAKGDVAKGALICLAEDVAEVASSAVLVHHVLALAKQKTPNTHMYPASQLAKDLYSAFAKPLTDACRGFTNRHQPLDGVGAVKLRKTYYFFELADLIRTEAPTALPPSLSAPDPMPRPAGSASIPDDILAAFDRLDEQSGGQNYVSLLDLRNALPSVERAAFDDAVNQLRCDRIVSLDPVDGRHERPDFAVTEAAIVDEGQWLVNMRRRDR